MKHEWRKHEKNIYIPKEKPELITIPSYKFFTIEGTGNPNENAFMKRIEVLYGLSYGIRMMPKKGIIPEGYFEYTVYPLEGIWDLSQKAKETGVFDKSELVYKIMIRQPDFVTDKLAKEIIDSTNNKNPNPLFSDVRFEKIEDGLSVQILHIGSYDDEPRSFQLMKEFCEENNLNREDLRHREIYLSDPRKVEPDKLKTVLRYFVKDK